MGKSQRTKGHNFERRIAAWLRALGIAAQRNTTEAQTGNTGDVHAELRLQHPTLIAGPEHYRQVVIQAKNQKSPSVWRAMDQARTAKKSPSDLAIAIVKRTHDQTLVCMDTATFALLVSGLEESL